MTLEMFAAKMRLLVLPAVLARGAAGTALPGPSEPRQLLFATIGSSCPPAESCDPPSPFCVEAERFHEPKLADYTILHDEFLAAGAYKAVYRAITPGGDPAAVGMQPLMHAAGRLKLTHKVSWPGEAPTEWDMPNWKEVEASLAAEFQVQDTLKGCPNTAQVLSHGMYSSPLEPDYYVNFMPLSAGGDLSVDNWPIPRDVSVMYSASLQLAKGLACMHAAGVAHLDIKPQNFNAKDENRTDVELADFGSSGNFKTGVGFAASSKESPHLWAGDKYIGDVSSYTTSDGRTYLWAAPEALWIDVRCYGRMPNTTSTTGSYLDYDPFTADMWSMGSALFNLWFPGWTVGDGTFGWSEVALGPWVPSLDDPDTTHLTVTNCDEVRDENLQGRTEPPGVDATLDQSMPNTALGQALATMFKALRQIDPRKRLSADELVKHIEALPIP